MEKQSEIITGDALEEFGRGERLIVPLVQGIERGERYEHESICWADTFSPDKVYRLAQVDKPYCHSIQLSADHTAQ